MRMDLQLRNLCGQGGGQKSISKGGSGYDLLRRNFRSPRSSIERRPLEGESTSMPFAAIGCLVVGQVASKSY